MTCIERRNSLPHSDSKRQILNEKHAEPLMAKFRKWILILYEHFQMFLKFWPVFHYSLIFLAYFPIHFLSFLCAEDIRNYVYSGTEDDYDGWVEWQRLVVLHKSCLWNAHFFLFRMKLSGTSNGDTFLHFTAGVFILINHPSFRRTRTIPSCLKIDQSLYALCVKCQCVATNTYATLT